MYFCSIYKKIREETVATPNKNKLKRDYMKWSCVESVLK